MIIPDVEKLRTKPKTFTNDSAVVQEILAFVSAGGTVYKICNDKIDDPAYPAASTVYKWTHVGGKDYNEEFAAMYEAAEKCKHDAWKAQIEDWTSPDAYNEVITTEKGVMINNAVVNKYRNCAEGRQWLLSKANSKRYGDKVASKVDLKAKDAAGMLGELIMAAANGDITASDAQTISNIVSKKSDMSELQELTVVVKQLQEQQKFLIDNKDSLFDEENTINGE